MLSLPFYFKICHVELLTNLLINLVRTRDQFLPFMVGVVYYLQGFIFGKYFLVIGDLIGLLAIEYFDCFEPLHDGLDLLFRIVRQIVNLFHLLVTPYV